MLPVLDFALDFLLGFFLELPDLHEDELVGVVLLDARELDLVGVGQDEVPLVVDDLVDAGLGVGHGGLADELDGLAEQTGLVGEPHRVLDVLDGDR